MATDNKYDRQLRLWGGNGQRALAESHICLLQASPTGTEALKNLVLPGIGKFTIVDKSIVTIEDCGNNFFVTLDGIGKNRCEVVTELLCEMNPDVTGFANVDSPYRIVEEEPNYFDQFNVIIASDLDPVTTRVLASLCWTKNIHLIIARAYGFIGYIRHVNPLHYVIESKPQFFKPDLRLSSPFPELVEFAFSFDIDSLKDDTQLHSHIPYVILLIQLIQEWKSSHGGLSPSTATEKKEFQNYIMSRRADDLVDRESGNAKATGTKLEEDNFIEAYDNYYYVTAPYEVPDDTLMVLTHEATTKLQKDSKNFFIICNAIKGFLDEEGVLPVSGLVPDMISTSDLFLQLQTVYQTKAKKDLDNISQRVQATLQKLGKPANSISPDYIQNVTKNSNFLSLASMRSLEDELAEAITDDMWEHLNPDTGHHDDEGLEKRCLQACPLWYIGLRAVDEFYIAQGRFPGVDDSNLAEDAEEVKRIGQEIATSLSLDDNAFKSEHSKEMTRYGASVIHNIAAFVGGIVSQETIKVVTHQYTPFNNTVIYNGIECNCATMTL